MFGLSPCELWVRNDPMAIKAAQSIALALGCPPELMSKNLFAKDSIRLGFKTKRNQTELNWRFPPCLLSDFHNAWRSYIGSWGRTDISGLT